MKSTLKNIVQPVADRLFKRLTGQSAVDAARLDARKDIAVNTERSARVDPDRPIHLLLVCHMPALWSMFETLYRAAFADREFRTTVVTLPCMHPNLAPGRFSDLGMGDFLRARGIAVVEGYRKEDDAWLTPESLAPDYVLFQTPYNLFPERWSAPYMAKFARVCYVPYATTLFRGDVDQIVHPEPFFRAASLVFAENPVARRRLIDRFRSCPWFCEDAFVLSGSPKFDYIGAETEKDGAPWKRGLARGKTRILWTPRWWTNDGSCHFFDYKSCFVEFCARHDDVDFVLRPHPLSIQNFLNTGELTADDLQQMELAYERSSNMSIDKGSDYQGTFLTSDVLVSDISSMLIEYLVTEKPIVYTHRVDLFNELGRTLSEGFYWVRSSQELTATLEMLIAGTDPLKEKRRELTKTLLFLPEGGAGLRIKNLLKADFKQRASAQTA